MKRKGFTLIELLAVIVVLAIIALIATPIVMNTIKNAKKGAAERSADNYVKALEQKVTEVRINGTKIFDGTYIVDENGNLGGVYVVDQEICKSTPTYQNCEVGVEQKINVEMSGNKPVSGKIIIKNGMVEGLNIDINGYPISYKNNKMVVMDEETISKYLSNSLCVSVDNDTLTIGTKYICELGDGEKNSFYLLEDGDTTTITEGRLAQSGEVSLIMDRNIGENGKGVVEGGEIYMVTKEDYLAAGGTEADWGDFGNHDKGPITANKTLAQRTSNWTKITDKSKINLPTYYQIDQQHTKNQNQDEIAPDWLTQNLVKGLNGYWVYYKYPSSSDKDNQYQTCAVYEPGYYSPAMGVVNSTKNGIRPVITISKSNLS